MTAKPITKVVIIGGGTSGWMTAAALSKCLSPDRYTVTLVESDKIGTIGVGEATLPHLRYFNQRLGIDERDFMRQTHATYKMGIEFANWGRVGHSYLHPFGDYGQEVAGVGFHHYWLKLKRSGRYSSIDDFSVPVVAAKHNRFTYPSSDPQSLLSNYSYAFHLDASLYAKFLRTFSEENGVIRLEGKVEQVASCGKSGFLESVTLEDGTCLDGDLFIDCSGLRAILIGNALKVGYEDWSHWLPCDRAVAMPSEKLEAMPPYTRASAQAVGWQWRIPLQHRTGNGYVYSSKFIGDDEALKVFRSNLTGPLQAEPNFVRFATGKRKVAWAKNCVAIGLSGGFLEPLESTSIYLIQLAIMKLVEFMPDSSFNEEKINEFNRLMDMEYERIRDFLILHYHATEREDSEFWKYCKHMTIPSALQDKMDLFKQSGYISNYKGGLFLEPSWLAVYLGQCVEPDDYDMRVDNLDDQLLHSSFERLKATISKAVESMPVHADFLRSSCAADAPPHPPAGMSLYGIRRQQ